MSITQMFPKQKPGVSVEDKSGEGSDSLGKQAVIKAAFASAIDRFRQALDDDDHGVNKAIGSIQRPVSVKTLKDCNLTVMILDKNDPQDHPMTWMLPNMFGGEVQSYVTRIPYRFVKAAGKDIRFEHLALHEVAHIVAGHLDKGAPDVDEMEQQHRVEYLVYTIVGATRYQEFIRALVDDTEPNMSDEGFKLFYEKWEGFVGVSKKKSKQIYPFKIN